MAGVTRKNISRSMSVGNVNYSKETERNRQFVPKKGITPRKGRDTGKSHTGGVENLVKQIHQLVAGQGVCQSTTILCAKETIHSLQESIEDMKKMARNDEETVSLHNLIDNILRELNHLRSQLKAKEENYNTMKEFYSQNLKDAKNKEQIQILELESEKQENDKLRRKSDNLQQKVTDYESRIHNNQQDLRILEEKKQELSNENLGLQKKIQKLEEINSDQKNKIAKLEAENQTLKVKFHHQGELSESTPQARKWDRSKTTDKYQEEWVQNWVLSHPPEDSGHHTMDTESNRPRSAATALTSFSHSATEYSHRPISSRSLRFSCANSGISTIKHSGRPVSCGSTKFSCANSSVSTVKNTERPESTAGTDFSCANSGTSIVTEIHNKAF